MLGAREVCLLAGIYRGELLMLCHCGDVEGLIKINVPFSLSHHILYFLHSFATLFMKNNFEMESALKCNDKTRNLVKPGMENDYCSCI